MEKDYTVPAQTRIGHVHLKVSDIRRSLDFYCGLLGFELVTTYGHDAAFISAGGYHHHIGLNTWQSKGHGPAPPQHTGLFHVAIVYPTRRDLARIYDRLQKGHIRLTGSADHGVSEALYLNDPDRNGLELYWDRPREEWPANPDGSLIMYTLPLDLPALLKELDE
jgi:catechol 2,3-dioxygenase